MWTVLFVVAMGLQADSAPTLDSGGAALDGDTQPLGEGNHSESAFWNESAAEPPSGQTEDDGAFPDVTSCDKYYRWRSGRRQHCTCEEGLLFDSAKLRCVPGGEAACAGAVMDPCTQQGDGLYPSHKEQCRAYYRCRGGKTAEEMTCPPGEAFSVREQACGPEGEVECVRPHCGPTEDGLWTLPGSACRAYYRCTSGTPVTLLCPDGQTFNSKLKRCEPRGLCYESICTGRVNGYYADTTEDCRRYFRCRGGRLQDIFSCPRGARFDGQRCCAAGLVKCDKPEGTAVAVFPKDDGCRGRPDGPHAAPGSDCRVYHTCLEGRTVARAECAPGQRFDGRGCVEGARCDDLCSLRPDGVYAGEGCAGYYQCAAGRMTRRDTCADGTLFDGRMCLPRDFVSCQRPPNHPLDKCTGLADGFHADYWNQCERYFYCSNHESVVEGSCAGGMVWGGDKCVAKGEVKCGAPEPWPGCQQLLPGVYQDMASGCSRYFYCRDGNRTALSCPAGRLYDGERCVPSAEYTCPSSRTDQCSNQSDGYRQDTATGCRSYIYCSNGNKITYVCPGRNVFNGKECVPPAQFDCPFKSTDCEHKQNGYHADAPSGCRKYYYCFSREKITTIECNGRKVFDGQRCVVPSPGTVCPAGP